MEKTIIDKGIKCPKCGYNISKQHSGKCPRCGAILTQCGKGCSGNCLKCTSQK